MKRELKTVGDTRALGAELASRAKPGTVIALNGDLGAGKTEFVRGFVAALPGCNPAEIASPTFALVHRYETEPPVWHLDLYRLESEAELAAIGGEEFFDPFDEITLVEWAERYPRWLPSGAWLIHLERISDTERIARVEIP